MSLFILTGHSFMPLAGSCFSPFPLNFGVCKSPVIRLVLYLPSLLMWSYPVSYSYANDPKHLSNLDVSPKPTTFLPCPFGHLLERSKFAVQNKILDFTHTHTPTLFIPVFSLPFSRSKLPPFTQMLSLLYVVTEFSLCTPLHI